MRIVIDTNVVISGVFFGGMPRKVLTAVVNESVSAYASKEIVDEYNGIIQEMISRKQGHIDISILTPLIQYMEIIEPETRVKVCRDKDDNKFIECAVDAKALYIVSGDKDLLDIEEYKGIKVITAKEFCEKYV